VIKVAATRADEIHGTPQRRSYRMRRSGARANGPCRIGSPDYLVVLQSGRWDAVKDFEDGYDLCGDRLERCR